MVSLLPPRPVRVARFFVGLLALSAGLTACVGNVANSLGGDTDTGSLGSSDDGSTAVAGLFATSSDVLESTGLHRINTAEYDNTVRDLLGTTLTFSDSFPADETANGFDNNAAALGMSTSRLQQFQLAAEALAAELGASGDTRLATLAPCASSGGTPACVSTFVTSFGSRAWRRPITSEEVAAVVATATATSGDSYTQQIQKATIALLMSPYFLYRVEVGQSGANGNQLTAYELASRLSYFLWSSMPDDALLAVAANGSLLTDTVLTAQTKRMLADDKASAFSANFAGQWLQLRKTLDYVPDPNQYPAWNAELLSSAVAQTQATFADLLNGTKPFHSLFDGNTTYVNDKLAAFYGLQAPGSSQMVAVNAPARRGILTQAAVLASTSFPNRTSLVHRGQFIAAQLMCTPPPGAPPNVPALGAASGNVVTQRQRLEAHVASPACSICHNTMDPYGFVLESFDAIGALRSTDNGGAIDTSATLPNGKTLANVDDLSAMLASDTQPAACMVQQLLTYALGRTLIVSDVTAVNALQNQFIHNGQRVDKIITSIVLSPMFRSLSQGAS